MAEREQRDVEADILQAIQEEDHTQKEQEMVVSGDHVLGAEIREGDEQDSRTFLDEALVARRDAVGEQLRGQPPQHSEGGDNGQRQAGPHTASRASSPVRSCSSAPAALGSAP